MALFSRLFRPAPPPPPPTIEERIAALDGASGQSIADIAFGDDAEPLRLAAIARLPYSNSLLGLAGGSVAAVTQAPDAVRRAAQQRLAQLIDTGAVDFGKLQADVADRSWLLSVAALCADPDRLTQAFALIDDRKVIASLVLEATSARVRQLAAESIEDPEELRRLVREVRGSDKTVYRILKQKCDALLEQERRAAQIQQEIEAVCASLTRHSHRPHDALFTPTLEHLNSQWDALVAHATPEARDRADQAIDRCREIVAEQLRRVAMRAAQEAAVANADAQRQDILEDLRAIVAELYACDESSRAAQKDAVARQLARHDDRWTQAGHYKAATESESTAYDRLRRAIGELSDLIAQHGTVARQAESFQTAGPDADLMPQARILKKTLAAAELLGDAAPVAATAAASALQAWQQARNDKLAAQALAVRQIGGLIGKTYAALNQGITGRAAGLRRAIEEKVAALPAVPAHIRTQLQELDGRLGELKDWKEYAVAPKRVELIAQMEALVGSKDDPDVLARQIKDLQDQWKTTSKGVASDDEAEWQRFHSAAQTAYQPCREHFEAQARLRAENLEKRKALLARLSEFAAGHDWEHPDWRTVATALRESRRQWRDHSPVDRAAAKALQESFDAQLRQLQERLDAEHARNVKQKKSLIARAQRLIAADDSRKAIDDVKHLQQLWKEVGPVPRADDQKLWEEFRQQCDAVYQKRQQHFTEQAAGLEANKARAVALCDEVERIAALSGADLHEGAKKIPSLREAFDAVGDVPRSDARALASRFERALAQAETAIGRQRALDEERGWNNLLEAANLLRTYRLALSEDASPERRATLKQQVETFAAAADRWPKGGLQAVRNELAKEAAAGDAAANESALRTLCIRAEILTDIPTPPADQPLRREYQVRRLMEKMGQGTAADRGQLDALMFEWIGAGPVPDAPYLELVERFKRCRAVPR